MKNENKMTVIIIGGSGSGKSTLAKKLVLLSPEQFKEVISATTRDIRLEDGEKEGVTYYYLTDEEFDKIPKVEEVSFAGNRYCVPEGEFDTDKDTIIVVEPHGAEQIIEYIDNPYIIIYMGGANKENMIKRGDSPEQIEKRLEADKIEELFENSNLVADKTIKKLTPNLHYDVYEFIQIFKKNNL